VEHLRGIDFKIGLRGTVRMETPVLYFYSPRETTLSVKVAFSKGLITEWYPHASRVEPNDTLTDSALYQKHADGSIVWDCANLVPSLAADFRKENRDNRYYAARETSATPLRVKSATGNQQEKFLFYRGVSVFPVPISASLMPAGKLLVRNLKKEEIPNTILFERRGDKLGYRLAGALQDQATLDPPELTATMDSLGRNLQDVLVAQGLYPEEAHAMFETWCDSWFEEGSRLFYIVPRPFVDAILPLSIHPAPAQTVRVFVGRLEIVTPATEMAVENAYASHDEVTLGKYSRFLEPIVEEIRQSSPERAKQIQQDMDSYYSESAAQARRGR
jgi:hypothetical protein